ncbi:uncharacterized protein LOC134778842 [Penaeus indicus]|uniref:uncharacterized protein LOC134778842 n=1 Tax=Penaeus indicus TaxID=29960 RepID=UPI00300C63E8
MSLKVAVLACVAVVALCDKAPVQDPHPPVYTPRPAYHAPAPYHAPEPAYHAHAHYEPEYPAVPPKYNYNYGVADSYSGVNLGHTESRDGLSPGITMALSCHSTGKIGQAEDSDTRRGGHERKAYSGANARIYARCHIYKEKCLPTFTIHTPTMSLKVVVLACVAVVALCDKAPVHNPLPLVYTPRPTPYHAPEPAYHAPEPAYHAPGPAYRAPEPAYHAPEPAYHAPELAYHAPEPAYHAPEPAYHAPEPAYHAPEPAYHAPEPAYHAHAHYEPEYPDVPPKYNYNYGVADGYSGANFAASESRDGLSPGITMALSCHSTGKIGQAEDSDTRRGG